MTAMNTPEELRMPVNAFIVPLCCFLSLPVFNCCFRICCYVLIFALYRFGYLVPKPL